MLQGLVTCEDFGGMFGSAYVLDCLSKFYLCHSVKITIRQQKNECKPDYNVSKDRSLRVHLWSLLAARCPTFHYTAMFLKSPIYTLGHLIFNFIDLHTNKLVFEGALLWVAAIKPQKENFIYYGLPILSGCIRFLFFILFLPAFFTWRSFQ